MSSSPRSASRSLPSPGLVVLVTGILSLLLAGTIAEPMRRLAVAAERVRKNIKNREQIPDFSERPDEIGNLSRALPGHDERPLFAAWTPSKALPRTSLMN